MMLCAGFPNMTASYLEDVFGNVYTDITDFLTVGITSTAIAWTVIATLGYSIMYAMHW
jgi:phosphate transporter